MRNYALPRGPCTFLNLRTSPWEILFLLPLSLCFSSLRHLSSSTGGASFWGLPPTSLPLHRAWAEAEAPRALLPRASGGGAQGISSPMSSCAGGVARPGRAWAQQRWSGARGVAARERKRAVAARGRRRSGRGAGAARACAAQARASGRRRAAGRWAPWVRSSRRRRRCGRASPGRGSGSRRRTE
jgi:hypothetical protein